jgi:hypothetical protein
MQFTLNVLRIRFVALALVIVSLALTSLARAQSPLAIGFEEAFAPDFLRRDLPLFKSELRLDDEQTTIAESLFADYQEQFELELAKVRADLSDAQAAMGGQDPEIDRRREELREQIAEMFEAMQEELENLPEGASPAEVRKKYEEEVRSVQEALEGLRPRQMDAEALRKMFEDAATRLEAWNQRKREMRETFVGNIQAILHDDAQRALWPPLERRLVREKSIGEGRLQGESVDLVSVVKSMKLEAEAARAVTAPVNDYEARMDAALRTRNDGIQAMQREMFRAVNNADRAALQRVLERTVEWRVAVRNVNDESAQAIAAALPEGERERFIDLYRQRGYATVFRSTQALRLIKAAMEMPGLTPAQSEGLASMLESYQNEVTSMNERVLQTVREHEPRQYVAREGRRLLPPGPDQEQRVRDGELDPAGGGTRAGADAIQQAFAQRNQMGQKYTAQLEALLGAELYERLPRGDRRIEDAEDDPDEPDSN